MPSERKVYLCGWVWGIERGDGYTLMDERRGRNGVFHSKVFTSKARVIQECNGWLQRHPKDQDWRPFYSGMPYETPNPDNARGMPEWQEEFGERTYVKHSEL